MVVLVNGMRDCCMEVVVQLVQDLGACGGHDGGGSLEGGVSASQYPPLSYGMDAQFEAVADGGLGAGVWCRMGSPC